MSGFDGVTAPTIALQFYKSGSWTSVATTDLLNLSLVRGRRNPSTHVEAGTLTATINNYSGIYDPDYTTASTWVVAGASILKPGLPCRLQATWSGTTYDLFYGWLETPHLNQGNSPTVTFVFTDGLTQIARAIAPLLTTTQFTTYTGETSSTRCGRMLTYANWAGGTAVSGYTVTMAGDKQDRSALAIIRECANAQGGKFYVTRDNTATLEGIGSKFSKVTRLAFNDDGTANTVKFGTIVTAVGQDGLYNDATISRDPNKQYRAYYTSSVSSLGYRSLGVTAPVSSDTAASNLSLLFARQWADPVTRITEVPFDGMRLGALYPDFLQLELGDFVNLTRHTVDGRTLTYQLSVEGYRYEMTKDGWSVRLYTWPLNPYTITV